MTNLLLLNYSQSNNSIFILCIAFTSPHVMSETYEIAVSYYLFGNVLVAPIVLHINAFHNNKNCRLIIHKLIISRTIFDNPCSFFLIYSNKVLDIAFASIYFLLPTAGWGVLPHPPHPPWVRLCLI